MIRNLKIYISIVIHKLINQIKTLCQLEQEEKIQRIISEKSAEFMELPGVVGVYMGQDSLGEFCIRIMVEKIDDSLLKKLPAQIDGIPVEIEEIGKIEPMW